MKCLFDSKNFDTFNLVLSVISALNSLFLEAVVSGNGSFNLIRVKLNFYCCLCSNNSNKRQEVNKINQKKMFYVAFSEANYVVCY